MVVRQQSVDARLGASTTPAGSNWRKSGPPSFARPSASFGWQAKRAHFTAAKDVHRSRRSRNKRRRAHTSLPFHAKLSFFRAHAKRPQISPTRTQAIATAVDIRIRRNRQRQVVAAFLYGIALATELDVILAKRFVYILRSLRAPTRYEAGALDSVRGCERCGWHRAARTVRCARCGRRSQRSPASHARRRAARD
jgi:hypothetical protein